MLSRPAVVGLTVLGLLSAWYLGRAVLPENILSSSSDWHSQVSQEGGFSVDLRGKVKRETWLMLPTGNEVNKLQADNLGPGGFTTFICQWSDAQDDSNDVEKVYDGLRQSELQASGGTLIDEQHILWLGHAARQIRFHVRDFDVVGRFVVIGRHLYTGKVLFEGAHERDVERFYSSWRLLH